MIKKGDANLMAYKGDHGPVNIYYGARKAAGWEYTERTGVDLTFDGTYEDSAEIVINGSTTEIGEGNKSSDNPYTLKSVTPFHLVSAGKNAMNECTFPYSLHSLPDGTRDYIEIDNAAKTAKLARNVGVKAFAGTEECQINATTGGFQFANIGVETSTAFAPHSTHYPGYLYVTMVSLKPDYGVCCGNSSVHIRHSGHATIAVFKAWLAAQYAAGTPVTVQYKLVTPVITDLDYETYKVLTFYPFTRMYTTGSEIPAKIWARVKKQIKEE